MDRDRDDLCDATRDAQQRRTACWKIEEFRREAKQSMCTELYQCCIRRVLHNYIACVVLAWSHLKHLVRQSGRTRYQVKRDLSHDYFVRQLKNPTVQMLLE